VLLANPKRLIIDVTVAGVTGGRISDEKVPRAWVVLSGAGKKMGVEAVKRELKMWHQENLSKYKWLRGGIEVVKQVRSFFFFFLGTPDEDDGVDSEVTNWEGAKTGSARSA
jgi:hypothetical protein